VPLGRLRVERRRFPLTLETLPLRVRALGHRFHHGDRGGGSWVVFIEQGLADDAARVILSRIELFPIDLIEVGAHFLPHSLLGAVGHIAHRANQSSELAGVVGQTFWAQHKDSDDPDDHQLLKRQPEHPLRIARSTD
jgi:hypothetical protein